MELTLKLLGGFAARDGTGKDLPLRTRKTRALLAYLAVNADKPQPRERLMALLWGDRSEQQARQSLNQALVSIRHLADSGDAPLIESDGVQVTLRGDALRSDVAQFRSAIASDPTTAAAIYDGPFLDGMSAPDPAFEEWLRTTRSELQSLACGALERAAEAAEDKGDPADAINSARRQIALDPLNEDAHRRLMRLLHRAGDRPAALRQYQICSDILEKELQVEPDVATTSLFEEIRRGGLASGAPQAPPSKLDASTAPLIWPNEPSIAVLPFENLSGEARGENIAEGLTEDVTTTLSKIPGVAVISSDSSRIYKEDSVLAQDVGMAFGVGYVLKGAIRTIGNRLRCSVRLVDTTHGRHLWAERFDKELEDIFALQDEIVRHVLVELQVKLTEGDGARLESQGTHNLEAWLLRVQGAAALRSLTHDGIARARNLFAAAHKLDPSWARPVASIGACHAFDARNGWSESREGSFAAGIEHAERAIAMDPDDPIGYIVLRFIYALQGKHDQALALIQKAVSLAPSDHMAVGNLGNQLIWMDQADQAVAAFERRRRLSPVPMQFFERYYGLALQIVGRVDDAVAVLEALAKHEPEYIEGLAQLAAAYVGTGHLERAKETTRKIKELDPAYTASNCINVATRFQDQHRSDWLRSLLIEAGLDE